MNRAIRRGERVTFRERCYDEFRRVHPWLPEWGQWQRSPEMSATVEGIEVRWRRRVLAVKIASSVYVICYSGSVKLDDRPAKARMRAKLDAEIEREKSARKKRTGKRAGKDPEGLAQNASARPNTGS